MPSLSWPNNNLVLVVVSAITPTLLVSPVRQGPGYLGVRVPTPTPNWPKKLVRACGRPPPPPFPPRRGLRLVKGFFENNIFID